MTNYEHIFESAMSYRKQGKSFEEFKNDKIVRGNAYGCLHFIDLQTNEMLADDVLEGIWCIAGYVSAYYYENEVDCDKCENNNTLACNRCIYSPFMGNWYKEVKND